MENGHARSTARVDELPPGEEVAQRYELLLDRFRRADGEMWRAVEIEAATGGRVTSSYASALRKGKFQSPGIAHLRCIAETMGFPFQLWYVEPELWDQIPGGRPPQPLDEVRELDPRERAVVQVMRGLDDRRKDAVVTLVRQVEVL